MDATAALTALGAAVSVTPPATACPNLGLNLGLDLGAEIDRRMHTVATGLSGEVMHGPVSGVMGRGGVERTDLEITGLGGPSAGVAGGVPSAGVVDAQPSDSFQEERGSMAGGFLWAEAAARLFVGDAPHPFTTPHHPSS